jgi:hypothetical protein
MKSRSIYSLVIFWLLIVIVLNGYFINKYTVGSPDIKSLSFLSDLDKNDQLVFLQETNDEGFNLSQPFRPRVIKNKLIFDFEGRKIRNFRVYIGRHTQTGIIDSILLSSESGDQLLSLRKLKFDHITPRMSGKPTLVFSADVNSYFQLKQSVITMNELLITEIEIFIVGLFLALLVRVIFRYYLAFFKPFRINEIMVCLFILSIFLPHPVFNVTFIISFGLILKDFQYKQFISNKTGLLVLAYFLVLIFNDIFVSHSFNSKIFETSLPLFFLPFFFACIPRTDFLRLFPISALLLSLYFFSTSLIDATIFKNIYYFSFDNFTKYIHPVYFSYLLVFSLIYLELNFHSRFSRMIFLPILILALLCCGSKLIISIIVLFYAWRFFKKQTYWGLIIISLIVAAGFLFGPTRQRFQEILNLKSLSVLSEHPIKLLHDTRINGLTLRLILWQESLDELLSSGNIIWGKGVDEQADKKLESRLIVRGVETGHSKYDPHNQYIASFYKMGFIGLVFLLCFCAFGFYLSVKSSNFLLLNSMLLFCTAMLTESVLQRVTGIYFFICIILLQSVLITNPSAHFENSNSGNQGNS